MESYIPIAYLNDFIFCPRSIYFHQLYGKYNDGLYKKKPQYAGKAAHESIDNKKYSTRKGVLQGLDVYSEVYGLCGKIDVFDISAKCLTERKRSVKTIYDGYILQLYAQYYCLLEMGYVVSSLKIHDLSRNKNYSIDLPDENTQMKEKFLAVVNGLRTYDLNDSFQPNKLKCQNCIYSNLCDKSLC
mgnify:CR=1 FL=1